MRDSFNNVRDKWIKEIRHYSPSTPIILAALRSDLRFDYSKSRELVGIWEAKDLCDRIGAKGVYECSALSGVGVAQVVDAAARNSLAPANSRERSKSSCTVM